jgi:hypothetical protein
MAPRALHGGAVRRIAGTALRHAGDGCGVGRACQYGTYLAVVEARVWQGQSPAPTETTACAFTVKRRGVLDGSGLFLGRPALQRRATVWRALHRDVAFHIDVDSPGGELFATREIGRIMRAEGTSIAVGPGASCLSACVFLLMGAIERHISGDARVGIHRPSLRAPQAGEPGHGSEDEIVAAMSEQLVLYAQQMHVPRTIIDAMMAVPPDRVKFLSAAELATYGISARDAGALEERRAHSPARLPPGAAHSP